VKVISAKPSDPLDAFKHEIQAVEQAGAAAAAAAGDAADASDAAAAAAAAAAGDADGLDDREGTPEELEFEDDDGTTYRWDRQLRKYVPAGEEEDAASAAAAAAKDGYDIEAMTFVAEEEVIPTLAAARAAEEAAAAAGAGSSKGKKVRDIRFRSWGCVQVCASASSCTLLLSQGFSVRVATASSSWSTHANATWPAATNVTCCAVPRCAVLCRCVVLTCSVLVKGVRARLAKRQSRLRELLQQTQQHQRQQQAEQQQLLLLQVG
jgi:hypothetical protein